MVISMVILLAVALFVFYSFRGSLTGFSVAVDNSEVLEGELFDESFGSPDIIVDEEMGPIEMGEEGNFRGPTIVSNSVGNRPEARRYFIRNLKNLALWLGGYFITAGDSFFGNFRFSLYSEEYKLAELDLLVDRDIDLSFVKGNISITDGKSYLHSNGLFDNVDLYVPRVAGQERVRICENASSFNQIYEGCVNDSEVTEEYVLELGDENLELSEDELYFIVKNISGTGGMSEGEREERSLGIFLISPSKNAASRENVNFYYNVSEGVEYCKLLVDDQTISIKNNLSFGNHNFSLENMKRGKHFWEISCKDGNGSVVSSKGRKITIIPLAYDFEIPENLVDEDIEDIENMFFRRRGFGEIFFLSAINLSGMENLSQYILIEKNFISLDSSKLPNLNKPAILTLSDLSIENPIILRDSGVCLDCEILSYEDGDLVFRVNHFSNYTASGNADLSVWDQTDVERGAGGNLTFYANYTELATGNPIGGATCTLEFGDGSETMSYNATSTYYEFRRTFASAGVHEYNVTCSAGGYTTLTLSDYVSLESKGFPNGATVSEVVSTTGPLDDPAGQHTAFAGNVTEINIFGFSTSQSWQGYYGEVSGTIQLANGDDEVMYNWSSESPDEEVYATRDFDVNFVTAGCADSSEIVGEENYLSQDTDDSDSVSNTFNEKNHGEFYVGTTQIIADSCNSTTLINSTGGKTFYEVLLADGASNIIYTALINQNAEGFDGSTHDFEMIVGEKGKAGDVAVTTYYFYIELS